MKKTKNTRRNTPPPVNIPSLFPASITSSTVSLSASEVGKHSLSSSSVGVGGIDKRKISSEESSLTAKNYRLAKELSELRVRHRDETKTVTRLTMENMNLASQCREAMNHIAILKKELSIHQRRCSDLLSFQRPSSDSSFDLHELNLNETAHTERNAGKGRNLFDILSVDVGEVSCPSEDQRTNAIFGSSSSSGSATRSPTFDVPNEFLFTSIEEKSHRKKIPSNFLLEERNEKKVDRGIDAAFGDLTSLFFHPSYKNSLPATPEKDASDEILSYLEKNSELKSFHSSVHSTGKNTVDFFDASFDTTFPTSFSPFPDIRDSLSSDIAFEVPEFSNPFFLASSNEDIPSSPPIENETALNILPLGNDIVEASVSLPSPLTSKKFIGSPSPIIKNRILKNVGSFSQGEKEHSKTNSNFKVIDADLTVHDLFPKSAMSTFENFSSHLDKSSLNHSPFSSSSKVDSYCNEDSDANGFMRASENDSLSLPIEIGNNAMTQAPYNTPHEELQGKELSTNSALVPTRLQQCRMKEKAGFRMPIDITKTNSNDVKLKSSGGEFGGKKYSYDTLSKPNQCLNDCSGRSIVTSRSSNIIVLTNRDRDLSDEMKKLDDIANAVSLPSVGNTSEKSPLTKRRSVKQPISYAEPHINSKLRRGDVYFPKKESKADVLDIATNHISRNGNAVTNESGCCMNVDGGLRQNDKDLIDVFKDNETSPVT